MEADLLEEADLTLLARLRFVSQRRRRGGRWGERRSTRRGVGLEFADYRGYAPGDDPRRIDWNVYARLDRPYVRLYEEEEELSVALLIDGSASMGADLERDEGARIPRASGEGEARWSAALRLAAALGAVTLLGGDLLTGALLGGREVAARWGSARGRGRLSHWLEWLRRLAPQGDTHLAASLAAVATRTLRPGLALLLTDGYDPAGLEAGVAALAERGHEVILLHLLTPEELQPPLRGDLRLVDVETGEAQEMTLDRGALSAYAARLAAWQAELRALAGKHGGRYVLLRSDRPLKRLLLEDLRHAGLLR